MNGKSSRKAPTVSSTLAALVLVVGIARGGEPRVRTLPQRDAGNDLSFSGPSKLSGRPDDCGEAARCELRELRALGGSRWSFREREWGQRADFDVAWSGDLIEKKPNGEFWTVWSVSGDGTITGLGAAKILVFEDETYLLVPVYYMGNGGLTADLLFHWKSDHWQEVDTGSWWKALALPACYEVRRNRSVDFEQLALERDVFLEGVAGLKGVTSGTLEVKFRLRNDRLEIASWQVAESADSWSEQPVEPIRCGSQLGPCPPCQAPSPRP